MATPDAPRPDARADLPEAACGVATDASSGEIGQARDIEAGTDHTLNRDSLRGITTERVRRHGRIAVVAFGLLAVAALALGLLTARFGAPHAAPVELDRTAFTEAPSSPVLEALAAARNSMNASISGTEERPEFAIRIACSELTRAAEFAAEPDSGVGTILTFRLRDAASHACSDGNPSAETIHDDSERLYAEVTEALR